MVTRDVRTLTGSVVAIVTPMKDNGDVDYEALKQLTEWHVTEGTDGIVVMGTTGESPTVDSDEWEKIVRTVLDTVAGRIPVIAGTGSNCTRSTVAKSVKASHMGVDGLLIVTPYYNKPTQEGLFRHYSAIAAAVPNTPIILYNVPGRTACDLLPETCGRLAAAFPNIIGTKEASGKMERYEEIQKAAGPQFRVFTGEDGQAMDAALRGAVGVISVTANVKPKAMHLMMQAAVKKDLAEAKRLNTLLDPLHKNLFIEPNPVPAKWVLANMGKIPGGVRLPLIPLSENNHTALIGAMQTAASI